MSCSDWNNEYICTERVRPYANLHYSELAGTIVLDTPWSSDSLDLTPVVQATETDTKMDNDDELKQLEFASERYITTKGRARKKDVIPYICLWQVMNIEDHKNADKDLSDGDVYMREGDLWKSFDLKGKLTALDDEDKLLKQAVNNLNDAVIEINNTLDDYGKRLSAAEKNITTLGNRIGSIEGLIYDYPADKTTKIPRGNMIFQYSVDNGSSYPYYIKAADDNGSNVVQGKVN